MQLSSYIVMAPPNTLFIDAKQAAASYL